MREIKFRGKRLDNGAWETGSLVIKRMGMSDEEYYIADKMTGHLIPVDPATVGQFTGLFDKRGKECHIGDIVRFTRKWRGEYGKEQSETLVGVVNHGQYFHSCIQADGAEWHIDNMMRSGEIIGNAHDNPELLESKPDDSNKTTKS